MVQTAPQAKSFDEFLGNSLVTGLTNALGPSGAQAVISHMGLGPFPSNAAEIDSALTRIFMKSGARVIERQVLKVLFDNISERFIDMEEKTFFQQVEDLKHRLAVWGEWSV